MIIGIAGRKQSGKSTAGRHLVDNGFVRLSFADGIRDMLLSLLLNCGYDIDTARLLLQEGKEQIIPELGKSPREMMQTLGTEWGRRLVHEDLWVLAASRRIKSLDTMHIVFDDVRFENEAAMIRDHGGFIIHVVRDRLDTEPDDYHASELGIRVKPVDIKIRNNGSMEYFLKNIWQSVRIFEVNI